MSDTPYYVYILRCSDNSLYTGITTDVDRRFTQHSSGRAAAYTRAHTPVAIVYRERVESKSAALVREYAIKQMTKNEKEAMLHC